MDEFLLRIVSTEPLFSPHENADKSQWEDSGTSRPGQSPQPEQKAFGEPKPVTRP